MISELKIFAILLFVIKEGQTSQLYAQPFFQQLPYSVAPIPHSLPFSHPPVISAAPPGSFLPHSSPFAPGPPILPHSLPAIASPGHVVPHSLPFASAAHIFPHSLPAIAPSLPLSPHVSPVGVLPPLAHSLPLIHHAIPIAPPVITYKHSVPYSVAPFVRELNVFNKLIAAPPLIAAPAIHHTFAPNFVPAFAQNLVHRPVISPVPLPSSHTSFFAAG